MPELGVILKQFIVGASVFAVGVLLYRTLFYEPKRRRPFLALGFLSVAGILTLIAELVMRAPLVSAEWRTYLYIACLLGVFVGFTGDAIKGNRRKKT